MLDTVTNHVPKDPLDLRNIDDVIEERCRIPPPKYHERARAMCMDFCYFESELEVFSDEEGITKAINGHSVGDARGILRIEKIKKLEAEKKAERESEKVTAPKLMAPPANVISGLRVKENPFVPMPSLKSE